MDWSKLPCYLLLNLLPVIAFSQPSPLGLWQTYDLDRTPRDLVRISQNKDQLVGIIEKSSSKTPICAACQGKWHNKPLKGMQIIWGLKSQGNTWKEGHVLSIDNGKTYSCELTVSNDSKVLHFSPYLGTPLFGVTLDWIRVK